MEKVKALRPKIAKSSTPKISAAKTNTPKTNVAKQKSAAVKTSSVKLKILKKTHPTSTQQSSKANTTHKTKTIKPKLIIGSLELCNLPELGISDLQIRVDTGAKTSSLHVNNITRFKKQGKPWVSFDIHPDIYNVKKVVKLDCAIHDVRKIKSSNGVSEERYVIKTLFKIGGRSWSIEINLTDRSDMSNLMLLGRQGMKSRILVDPSKTFLMSNLNT